MPYVSKTVARFGEMSRKALHRATRSGPLSDFEPSTRSVRLHFVQYRPIVPKRPRKSRIPLKSQRPEKATFRERQSVRRVLKVPTLSLEPTSDLDHQECLSTREQSDHFECARDLVKLGDPNDALFPQTSKSKKDLTTGQRSREFPKVRSTGTM